MNHLIAITGFELPVLSQALWWWNKNGVHFKTITIVTTDKGLTALRTGKTDKGVLRNFLGATGVLAELYTELGINEPEYRHEILDSPDGILEDTSVEAHTIDHAAMRILKVIQNFTDEDDHIYCMYAGGRRAMVAQLVSTLVVAGDPARFSLHYVKKNKDLLGVDNFYYPTADLDPARGAPIEVFPIPFPMLGPIYGDSIKGKTSYQEVMKSTQAYINYNKTPPITVEQDPQDPTIITQNTRMEAALTDIVRHAKNGFSPIILDGPTGTGKDLAAALYCYQFKKHNNVNEKTFQYLTVNLAAIPEKLQVSTLFGYVKGAFTGAEKDTPGVLEKADKGVVFLDELNSACLELQATLLRFLENGEIQAVGAAGTGKKVKVQVVFAVNEQIGSLVREKRLRPDFFHRAKAIVRMPALHERREDIPLLAGHFLSEYAKTHNCVPRHFTQEAMEYLQSRTWKGNVRELKNFVERTVARAGEKPGPLNIELEYVDEVIDSLVQDDLEIQLESFIENWINRNSMQVPRNGGDVTSIIDKMQETTYRLLYSKFNGIAAQASQASGIPSKTISNNWKKPDRMST